MAGKAYILRKDDRFPKGFRAMAGGRHFSFFPDGVNPKTGEFDPVIASDNEMRILRRQVQGANVEEVDLVKEFRERGRPGTAAKAEPRPAATGDEAAGEEEAEERTQASPRRFKRG